MKMKFIYEFDKIDMAVWQAIAEEDFNLMIIDYIDYDPEMEVADWWWGEPGITPIFSMRNFLCRENGLRGAFLEAQS